MARPVKNRFWRFFIALIVGGALGALVAPWLKGQFESGAASHDDEPAPLTAEIEESPAWQYARAYQEGNWQRVLEITLWVRERLDLVRQTEGPDAVAKAQESLIADFSRRTLTDNQLRDTGVEDQYVFTPGAQISFDSVDNGNTALERPVAARTWLLVRFPSREKALLDSENIPIRSVRVGINVSDDGYVLKASVIGNLDIDWDSIRYDWPTS